MNAVELYLVSHASFVSPVPVGPEVQFTNEFIRMYTFQIKALADIRDFSIRTMCARSRPLHGNDRALVTLAVCI